MINFADSLPMIVAQSSDGGGGLAALIPLVFGLAVSVFFLWCVWTIFARAGEPGWACLVPIYNVYVMIKIAGLEWWYLLLLFVPLVNIFVAVYVNIKLAEAFGKGLLFGLGLAFFGIIFIPILALSGAEYEG